MLNKESRPSFNEGFDIFTYTGKSNWAALSSEIERKFTCGVTEFYWKNDEAHICYNPLSIDVKVIPHKVPCLDTVDQNLGKYKLEFKAEPLGFRTSEAYQYKTVCDFIISKIPTNWETEAFYLVDGKLAPIFERRKKRHRLRPKPKYRY
jgi:hypothetical protein